jgi:hypothetical protein
VVAAPQDGLIPLYQIKVSDLLPDVAALIGADYLLVWHSGRDLFTEGVVVMAVNALASLPPVEDRSSAPQLPLFQMFPERPAETQIPSWEDFVDHIPSDVAQMRDASWFFTAPAYLGEPDCPVIIGGWPQWIQGSQWPDGGTFVLEIRSTDKGRLFLGDGGSLYLFQTAEGWCVWGDCN